MTIYLIIAMVLFLGTFSYQGKAFFYIGLISMWGLMAFRHPDLGGTDAGFYQNFFESVPSITGLIEYDSVYSWGYTFFNSFAKTLSDSYIVYQIIYSTCCFLLFYYIINKFKFTWQQKCLFLFSFYCFRYMWDMWIILRQNMADIVFWILTIYIYSYWKKKKNGSRLRLKMLLGIAIILPASFHTSGWINIILLPLFYFIQKQEIRKKCILVVTASVVLFFVLSPSFSIILNLVSNIDSRYMMYDNIDGGSNYVYYFIRLFIFLLFVWKYDVISNQNKDYFLDMMAMMVLVGSINAPIIVRMCDYFSIGMYGLLACLPSIFKPQNRCLVNITFCCLMLLLLYRFLLILDDGALMEYTLGI